MATPGTMRAIALGIVSTVCAAITNGLIRDLSSEVHPLEIAFFRCLFGVFVLAAFLTRGGWSPLRTERLGLHMVRGALQAGSMLLFFMGLSLAPLAKVSALNFSTPLFATLLAFLVLHETIRVRRIVALAVGFLGALLILRPGVTALDAGAHMILVSAAMSGLILVIIKMLARTDSSLAITIYGTLFALPLTLLAALPVWTTPALANLIPLIGIGAISSLGNLCWAQALKESEVTVVAPLEFAKLPWVAIIGYVYFSEVPDIWTWVGGLIIFSAATYIAYRERRLYRPEASPPA